MLGHRVTPEPTVTYLVQGDGTEYETPTAARKNGTIQGVSLTYYCPACNAPNNAAYTTPVPDGLKTNCDHCNYELKLLDREETTRQYTADGFDQAIDPIEKAREARLMGEREPTLTANSFKRKRRIGAVVLMGFVILHSLGIVSAVSMSVYAAIGAFFIGLLPLVLTTFYISTQSTETGFSPFNKHHDMYERGLRRKEGEPLDPPMYTPPELHKDHDNKAEQHAIEEPCTE